MRAYVVSKRCVEMNRILFMTGLKILLFVLQRILRVLTGFKISEKMCRIIWDRKWEQEKVDLPATQNMGDIFKGGSTKYHEPVGHRLLFFRSWGWNMSGE